MRRWWAFCTRPSETLGREVARLSFSTFVTQFVLRHTAQPLAAEWIPRSGVVRVSGEILLMLPIALATIILASGVFNLGAERFARSR